MAIMFVANNVFAAPYTADDFVITVKTDNAGGASSDTQFAIPTTGGGYNYSVDCSYNGSNVVYTDTNLHGNYTCDYGSTAGTYTIIIHGSFPRIYFNGLADNTDGTKILTIEQWGTGAWTSMNHAFDGCGNLVVNAIDTPNLSNVTDMSNMFQNVFVLNNGTGNWHWDTSHVHNMSEMFVSQSHSNFNKDLSSWDVSNVTNMSNMFFNTDFNQDISGWDVSDVTDFSGMFVYSSFNQNIGNWDVSSATDISWMFMNDTSFNQDIGHLTCIYQTCHVPITNILIKRTCILKHI